MLVMRLRLEGISLTVYQSTGSRKTGGLKLRTVGPATGWRSGKPGGKASGDRGDLSPV